MRSHSRGQALVEAVGTLWILVLLFVCLYFLFLMAIDKLRSLDAVYHMGRAAQVGRSPSDYSIRWRCFGRRLTHVRVRDAGSPIKEVVFSFRPSSFRSVGVWHSVMRVVSPDPRFLESSWPGARGNQVVGVGHMTREILALEAKVQANQDPVIDPVEDVRAARRARPS